MDIKALDVLNIFRRFCIEGMLRAVNMKELGLLRYLACDKICKNVLFL